MPVPSFSFRFRVLHLHLPPAYYYGFLNTILFLAAWSFIKEECYTFSIRLSATLLYTVTSLVLAHGCLAPSVSQSTDKEPAWFAKKMKLAGNIQLRICLLETTVGLQICMSNVKTWIAPATSLLQNSCRPKPSTSCQCSHINDLPQVGVHPLLAVGTGYTENASGDFTQHPTIHWWQKSRRILRQRLDLTAPSVPHDTALSPCTKAQSGADSRGLNPQSLQSCKM